MEPASLLPLLRLARQGDPDARERLLAGLHPFLLRQARLYADPARPDESVHDLVQEVSLRVWQHLDQFRDGDAADHAPRLFRRWLAGIVRTVGLNRRRDARRRCRRPATALVSLHGGPDATAPDPPAAGPSPSGIARTSEEAALVRAALNTIPDPTDRAVARLFYLEELSLHVLAPRLGLSYDQARAALRRARDWLSRALETLP